MMDEDRTSSGESIMFSKLRPRWACPSGARDWPLEHSLTQLFRVFRGRRPA